MTDLNAIDGGSLQAYELSPQQMRAFRFRSALAPTPVELGLRLTAALDLPRLQASLLLVLERHEILRTSYRTLERSSIPGQVIHPRPLLAWNAATPSGGDPSDAATVSVDIDAPSAAGAGTRLRLRVSGAELDAASLARLASEWAAAYLGLPAAEAPMQYADYAAWRNELATEAGPARDHWLRQIQTRIPGGPLPFRGRSSNAAAGEAHRVRVPLSDGLSASWREAATALAQPPGLLALAAWVALLHQHGDSDAFSLGYDDQERARTWEDVLGLCSEPLPLRVQGLSQSTGVQLLDALAGSRAELLEWRDRFPSAADAEPYAVGFRHVPIEVGGALADAGLRIESLRGTAAPHQLLLEAIERADGADLFLHYAPAVYDATAAALIADQYATLLAALCARPDAPLRELNALGSSERRRVLEVLGRPDPLTAPAQERYRRIAAFESLGACFSAAARERPTALAVTAGARQLTHAELEEGARRVAGLLQAAGVGAGSRVAHFLSRSIEAVVALRAIIDIGAVYVPIDPDYPTERIAYLLCDCGAERVLTHSELVGRLPEAWQSGERWVAIDAVPATMRPAERSVITPDQVAYVIYTSGSTGQPRGVPITHGGALHSLAARVAYYPEPIEHFLLLSSFAFDSSIAGLFGTLAQGGCLHLASDREQKDADRIARIVSERGVTHLLALPSLYQLVLHSLPELSHGLRAAIVAGEACPRALVLAHHERLPGVRLYNEYGATEAAVWSTVAECSPDEIERPVSIGRPIPGASVYVLDEGREPRAPGMTGEIYVAGPGLSPGYLERPELTLEKFVEHRGERVYRTGDYGYWDDRGELVFVGRADGQIKIRGHRIELGEIEAALRRVTGLDELVVLADRGDDQQVFLRAFFQTERALDAAELRRELSRLLPEPMLPRDMTAIAEFPLGPNGKLDRRALLALEVRRQRAAYVAPETPTERRLAASWQRLLGVEDIGASDDFFVLGGHSLLAIRLVHEIQAAFAVDVPVLDIFEHSSLRALAAQIERLGASPAADAPRLERAGAITRLGAGAGPSAPRLFCIDPTGQHASAYEPIGSALAGVAQVLGVELGAALLARGPNVEALARQLGDELLVVQPEGAYHLLGWSLGGVLALAVARELEARGLHVASVTILDSQPPTRLYRHGEPDPIAELAEYVDPERRGELLGLPAPELEALRLRLTSASGAERVREAARWAVARGFLPSSGSLDAYLPRHALLRDAARFVTELPPSSVRAALRVYWTSETLARQGGAPIDWQVFASASARGVVVTGDHAAVLRAPMLHEALRLELSEQEKTTS